LLKDDAVSLYNTFKCKGMERSNLQRSRNRSIPKVKIKQRRINDRYRHTTHKTTGDWLKINSTKPNGKKLTQKINISFGKAKF
jgi:hypothetical protein